MRGFVPPTWEDLAAGLRPAPDQWEIMEPGQPRHGWQKVATEPVHGHHITSAVWPWLSVSEKALLRSQGGPLAGIPFTCFTTSPQARFDSSVFRVLLLRRLWQPLPPSSRFCLCGLLLDPLGHHRAACGGAGVLGRQAFALESAAARVCREAAARVTTNVKVRDLDLVPQELDADGLPLFHGAQLAVDKAMKRDGTPQPGSVDVDARPTTQGMSLPRIARLVVLACETGGRWSSETQCFLRQAAKVEHDFGVQWCSCFGVVPDGGSCCCWTRRPNTFHR